MNDKTFFSEQENKRDLNEIKRKKRKNVRVPQGYQMQHKRGFEARTGYG
ncbi:polymorphic toxin type 8 domain-containing protein [Paenibacillus xylanexedens]